MWEDLMSKYMVGGTLELLTPPTVGDPFFSIRVQMFHCLYPQNLKVMMYVSNSHNSGLYYLNFICSLKW